MDEDDYMESSLGLNEGESPLVNVAKPRALRKSWLVAITGSLVILAVWGNFFCFGVILVPLLCQYQSGRAVTALVGSIGYGVSVTFAPITTQLTARFGAPRVLTAAMLLTVVGVYLSSLPDSIYPWFFTYGAIVGVGGLLGYVCVIGEIPSYFPPDKQSRAIALVEAGSVVGMLVLAPLLDWLVNRVGWRHALSIFSALLFTLMLPAPLTFVTAKKKHEIRRRFPPQYTDAEEGKQFTAEVSEEQNGHLLQNGGDHTDSDESEEMDVLHPDCVTEDAGELPQSRLPKSLKPYKEVLCNRQFVLLLMTTSLYYFCFTAPAMFMVDESTKLGRNNSIGDEFPTDLSLPECQPKLTDALLYTYMSAVMLVLFLFFGWLFDNLTNLRHRLFVIQALYMVGALALIFVINYKSKQWHFVVFSLLFGVARAPDCLHQVIVLQLVGDAHYPHGVSLVCFLSGVSDAISPPIVGLLADKTGSFTFPFGLLIGVFTSAAILLLFLPGLGKESKCCWPRKRKIRESYRLLVVPQSDSLSNLSESKVH